MKLEWPILFALLSDPIVPLGAAPSSHSVWAAGKKKDSFPTGSDYRLLIHSLK